MSDETQPFDTGVTEITIGNDDRDRKAREAADTQAWMRKLNAARKFDKGAREQYAKDRLAVKNPPKAFKVSVPIAAVYIDILKAYLYARNPDLNVTPAEATLPPPMDDVLNLARKQTRDDKEALAQGQEAGLLAAQQLDGQPVDARALVAQAVRAKLEQIARERAEEMIRPFHERHQEAKQLAQTLEILIARFWQRADLKGAALSTLGAGLTVATGWFKATWQERQGEDPTVAKQIEDLQTQVGRVRASVEGLAEDEAAEPNAKAAELEQQIAGLKERLQVPVSRGLAIDFISSENIQVAPGVNLDKYLDAPWIAHYDYPTLADAKAMFPGVDLDKATSYYPEKAATGHDPLDATQPNAEDAERFRRYPESSDVEPHVCVIEVWNRQSGQVLTFAKGVPGYAKPPYTPPRTRQFYPFFQFAPLVIDGERHPQSLVERSCRLLDEYNRARSNFAEIRRRTLPKTIFDRTNLSSADASAISSGTSQEMVGVAPTVPGTPVGNLIQPVAYARVDMGLYDTAPIRAELEMIWGIQEALSSSIQTAKTATEAEIQQHGTQSRLDFMHNALDTLLSRFAVYTAELLLGALDREDVVQIAGDWALWPEGLSGDELDALVLVDIRAGSSGKPNTTQEQRAWAGMLPLLQQTIMEAGQLRRADPDEIANCLDELVIETFRLTQSHIDAERFLPKAPRVQPPQMPAPMPPPGAPNPSPQGAEPGQPGNPSQPTEVAA